MRCTLVPTVMVILIATALPGAPILSEKREEEGTVIINPASSVGLDRARKL